MRGELALRKHFTAWNMTVIHSYPHCP
jgi:hypothetical protein